METSYQSRYSWPNGRKWNTIQQKNSMKFKQETMQGKQDKKELCTTP